MSDTYCRHCGQKNTTDNVHCVGCGRTLRGLSSDSSAPGAVAVSEQLFGPGSYLGSKYELCEQIGAGSMGVVFRAIDTFIGREVAIKSINLDAQAGEELLQDLRLRFLREARASGTLNHPNIVTVYDAGESNDYHYIVMELLDGETLKSLGRRRELIPTAKVVSYVRQMADALEYSHQRQIVHRDIKPENIIVLRDDRVKITDFGIAKVLSSTGADLTRGDRLLGTPNYMAPEQVKGESVDGRSDLFSLGCVFYELLTKKKPFHQASVGAILFNIMSADPVWLQEIHPDFPRCYDDIVRRLLSKDPAGRFQTARELIEALERISPADSGEQVDRLRLRCFGPKELRESLRPARNRGDAPETTLLAPMSAGGGDGRGGGSRPQRPATGPRGTDPGASRIQAEPTPPPSIMDTVMLSRPLPGGKPRPLTEEEAEQVRVAFQEATRAYRSGRYEDSARELRLVLAAAPDHEAAAQFLAMVERKLLEADPNAGIRFPQPGAGDAVSAPAPRRQDDRPAARALSFQVFAVALLMVLLALTGGGLWYTGGFDQIAVLFERQPAISGDNGIQSIAAPTAVAAGSSGEQTPESIEEHYRKAAECYDAGDDGCFLREIDLVLEADPRHQQAQSLLMQFQQRLK